MQKQIDEKIHKHWFSEQIYKLRNIMNAMTHSMTVTEVELKYLSN